MTQGARFRAQLTASSAVAHSSMSSSCPRRDQVASNRNRCRMIARSSTIVTSPFCCAAQDYERTRPTSRCEVRPGCLGARAGPACGNDIRVGSPENTPTDAGIVAS
jgi:hypothetical protein